MGWIGKSIDWIKSIQMHPLLMQNIRFGMMVACVVIIWMGLICVTGTLFPLVFVTSGSMEPGVKRGDLLFVYMNKEPIRAGEIVVFKIDGDDSPIGHRVIKVHERRGDSGEVDILTKGDNNEIDDINLYGEGQLWLHRDDIMGRIVGYLPYVGWFYVIMEELPIIKYIIGAALAVYAMILCQE